MLRSFSSVMVIGLSVAVASGACSKQTIAPSESVNQVQPSEPPEDGQAFYRKGVAARDSGDNSAAFVMFTKSCELKYPDGCESVAYLYAKGSGVALDLRKAADFNQQACDLGGAWGCIYFATRLKKGDGIPADPQKALSVLDTACRKLRSPDACEYLHDELNSDSDPEMKAKAPEAMRLACEYGSKYACTEVKAREAEAADEAEYGSDSDGSASPVTTNAYGIRWTVSGELVKYLKIKKVECSKLRSTQTCYLTIELPEGGFEERGQLTEAIAYDGDDVQVAKRPVGGMNFRDVAPGTSIKVRIGTLGDRKSVV